MEKTYDYEQKELAEALRGVGVQRGDVVFSHVGMGFCGIPKEGRGLETMFQVIYNAFREVLGTEGTLIVPTYTYSFCNGEPFDVVNSPSKVGYFTEKFRKLPGVIRSVEPIFSVAGIGPRAKQLLENLPLDCFGVGSVYDRLVKNNALICNIGVGFRYATLIHHAEQIKGVPYRFKKMFKGKIIEGGIRRNAKVVYYVRNAVDDETTLPDLSRLEKDAEERGFLKTKVVGRGRVACISCRGLYDLCSRGIDSNPYYLAKGEV